MFSLISKIKIHPSRNIRADLTNNIFTASVRLTEHKIKSQNGIFSKLKGLFDKPSEYEFSKVKLLHKNNLPRQFCMWSNNSTSIKIIPIVQRALENSQIEYAPYYFSKRNTSGPHVKNPQPPIREPNMPENKVKKEKIKEDKKIKKPAVYVNEERPKISQADLKTVDDIRKILRHKWGVKLVKDVALPKSDTADPAPASEVTTKVRPDDRVLLGIVNKTDAELENSYIKRTKGNNFTMDKIAVLQATEPDETTAMDTEYYVPAEVKEGEEPSMWKNAAAKSSRPALERGPTPEELEVAESIFIRPEPPAPKSDEKGIETPDLLHVTKLNQNTINIKGSKNKTNNTFWSFLPWLHKTKPTMTILYDSNSSKKEEHKGSTDLIQKPAIVKASKLPTELPEKSLQNFKLKRLQSINRSEAERIYELKNYRYIKLSDMRPADELEILQKDLERQKNDTKLSSSKP